MPRSGDGGRAPFGKPVVVCCLGLGAAPGGPGTLGRRRSRTPPEAAAATRARPRLDSRAPSAMPAAVRARPGSSPAAPGASTARRAARPLFTGGTLAHEARLVIEPLLGPSRRPPAAPAHRIVDLGADEFTRGRPHPDARPAARDARVREAGSAAGVGVAPARPRARPRRPSGPGRGRWPQRSVTPARTAARDRAAAARRRLGRRDRRRSAGTPRPGRRARGRRRRTCCPRTPRRRASPRSLLASRARARRCSAGPDGPAIDFSGSRFRSSTSGSRCSPRRSRPRASPSSTWIGARPRATRVWPPSWPASTTTTERRRSGGPGAYRRRRGRRARGRAADRSRA